MTAIQRATDPDSPLTSDMIDGLVEAIMDGMPRRWAAIACGISPRTLAAWIDLGSKPDGMQPYRGLVFRLAKAEAELMREMVKAWKLGQPGSIEFLKRRWPGVWGNDAEPDLPLITNATSHADELAQLEDIVRDPYAYGVEHIFEKHGRLRPDGT